MRIPAILDIEASGFGRGSYPIEVGVAMPDGTVVSYLIAPHPDWTHWSDEAERLHGLSRELLLEKGFAPRQVAEQLNVLLEGQTVYSDGWGVDSSWLALLFYYAGCRQAFQLDTLTRILADEQLAVWDKTRDDLFAAHDGRRHRAGHDARILQQTYIDTHGLLRKAQRQQR
ncbi:hypothetical protein NFC81_05965 [Salinispirillum sp. LH 10-3-1]|uniref:Exonuclease domain-containing protein n=1 Tax=Salinispirillum sp. LH 10-3-1 TaxID=2952525 RepID=A0AB38YJV6_9GAMM